MYFFFFFFFQAEDGIRDDLVTGVQTCALPIFAATALAAHDSPPSAVAAMWWMPPNFSVKLSAAACHSLALPSEVITPVARTRMRESAARSCSFSTCTAPRRARWRGWRAGAGLGGILFMPPPPPPRL